MSLSRRIDSLTMLKPKLKKKGNKLDELMKGIKNLSNETVQVGHFKSQGVHSSGYTYPELMALHNNPVANGFDFPPRPVLDILFFRNEKLNSPEIKSILKKYSKNEPTPANNKMLLEELGQYLKKKEKNIFGSSALAPNAPGTIARKGKNSPLVDTGELRSKIAYKTSIDKIVKEN